MMTGFVSNSFAKKLVVKENFSHQVQGFLKMSIWRGFSRGFEQYGQAKCGQSEWWTLSDYTLEIWCLNQNVGNTAKVSLLLTIELLILNCSGFNENLNCVSGKILLTLSSIKAAILTFIILFFCCCYFLNWILFFRNLI